MPVKKSGSHMSPEHMPDEKRLIISKSNTFLLYNIHKLMHIGTK